MSKLAAKPTAIIFDKDGTLLKMNATWGRAMALAVEEVGSDAEHKRWLAEIIGIDLSSQTFVAGSLTRARTAAQTSELISIAIDPGIFYASVRKHADGKVYENTGASELLSDLHSQGYRIGLATNDSESGGRSVLKTFGWTNYFESVIGSDSGFGHKPDPEMLLGSLSQLNASPDKAIMVGDTTADLRSAKSAGIFYVQLGPLELNESGPQPDLEIAELAELGDFLDKL